MDNTIIIILCILLLYFILRNNGFEGFGNAKKLSFVQDMELKKLLRIIHETFTDNKIEYSITGRTLLGAINYKNLIPGDSYASIFIFDKDVERIENIDWKKYGCVLHKIQSAYKLCFVSGKLNCFPFVEIFVTKKENDKLVYNNGRSNDYLFENELYPLKKYQFGDLLLNGPNKIASVYQLKAI